MTKLDKIPFGECTVQDLANYMNERHLIWHKRFVEKKPKPWTEDKILQQYKFTNCFRQLDKGTAALQEMLKRQKDGVLILFNIIWYRYFNLYVHAEQLGFVTDYTQVEEYITAKAKKCDKVFTGAWMTTGVRYEDKHISYLRACKEAWDRREMLYYLITTSTKLETVCAYLKDLYMVGDFLAYELACDLRFTKLLNKATDTLTFANLGPGAQRGLKRLGMPYKNQKEGCESMRELYDMLIELHISYHIIHAPWPFELREVEHNLCEFDKYQRVKNGEGHPRSKYPGV